jgi:hypothetical protein
MFILFVNAFTSAFTTTQPTMDFDAPETPYPIEENTQSGKYIGDEYFEYNDEVGSYEYTYSINNEYVKNVLDTLPATMSTVKALIQKLDNQISILSSYMT